MWRYCIPAAQYAFAAMPYGFGRAQYRTPGVRGCILKMAYGFAKLPVCNVGVRLAFPARAYGFAERLRIFAAMAYGRAGMAMEILAMSPAVLPCGEMAATASIFHGGLWRRCIASALRGEARN